VEKRRIWTTLVNSEREKKEKPGFPIEEKKDYRLHAQLTVKERDTDLKKV